MMLAGRSACLDMGYGESSFARVYQPSLGYKVGFDHAMTVGKHDSVHSPEQKTVEY